MIMGRRAVCAILACAVSVAHIAHAEETTASDLQLELNTVEDINGACRLTFVAHNQTGRDIEQAVFETVIFDASGSVMILSLFDFRDLPDGKPRVRQFDVPGTSCAALGQALVNGANTCLVSGEESDMCGSALSVHSRIEMELRG